MLLEQRILDLQKDKDAYDDDESYARDLGWNEGEVAGYEEILTEFAVEKL